MGKHIKAPKSPWRKTPLGSRKMGRTLKSPYYESPLKHIQLSGKRWEAKQAQRKLIGKDEQLTKIKSVLSPKRRISLQDSVIILSDNESETNFQQVTDSPNVTKRKRTSNACLADSSHDSSVMIIEPLRRLSTKDQQTSSRCLRSSTKLSNTTNVNLMPSKGKGKKRKRSINDSLVDNESCPGTSEADALDNQIANINTDGENIAPGSTSEGCDDIVVVWSSASDPPLGNEETPENQTERHDLFKIDNSPDSENLKCLEKNNSAAKKQKMAPKERSGESGGLPFSTAGLKFPKARKVNKQKAIKRFSKHRALHSSTSTSTTTPATDASDSENRLQPSGKLREIVIDGNNIALQHSNGKTFSERGLKIVVDYFQQRGHSVKVFVPQYRRLKSHSLLEKWYIDGIVVFTPSRKVCGRRITPYDDRFILEYATVCNGIVVSSDQYRDLYEEKPEWRDTITNRLLTPTFVGDYVMFPEDPLGRGGPTLENFLRC